MSSQKVVSRYINRVKLAEELIARVMAGVEKGLSTDDAVRATLKTVGIRFNEQLAKALSAIYKQGVKDVSKSVGATFTFTPLDKAMIHRILYSPAFDLVMHNYDQFAKSQIRKVLEDVTTIEPENIQQIKEDMVYRLGVVEHRGYNIARTEMANIYNIALEEQYKRIDPTGEAYLYKWFGPDDMRTTDICTNLTKITKNGVTLGELKKIIKEEAQNGKYAIPGFIYDNSRPWVPHFQCRHTFIAERRTGEVLKELEKERVYLKPGEQPPQGKQVHDGPRGGRYYDSGEGEDVGEDPSIPQWVDEYQQDMGGKIQMRVQMSEGPMWVAFDIESVDLISRTVTLKDQAGNVQEWPMANFRADNVYYVPPTGPPVEEGTPDLPAREPKINMTPVEKWERWPGGKIVTRMRHHFDVHAYDPSTDNWVVIRNNKHQGFMPGYYVVDYIPPSDAKPAKEKKPFEWLTPSKDLTSKYRIQLMEEATKMMRKYTRILLRKNRTHKQERESEYSMEQMEELANKLLEYHNRTDGWLTQDDIARVWIGGIFGPVEGAGMAENGDVYFDAPTGTRSVYDKLAWRLGPNIGDMVGLTLRYNKDEARLRMSPKECSLSAIKAVTRLAMEGGVSFDGPKFVADRKFNRMFNTLHPKIKEGTMQVMTSCGEDMEKFGVNKLAIQVSKELSRNTLGQAFPDSDVTSYSPMAFTNRFARYSNEEVKAGFDDLIKIAKKPSTEMAIILGIPEHSETMKNWNYSTVEGRLQGRIIHDMMEDMVFRNTFQLTMAHETGHQIFFKIIKERGVMYAEWKGLGQQGVTDVTKYAREQPTTRGEPHEPFAECYTLYKNVPEYLKVASPEAYDYFKKHGFKEGY